ncbi:MAG: inorganic phosphate transporter [Thermodesulfobacteriota bacterium]
MSLLVLIAALCVAFVNGANDNMKGVATLYAADVLSYRQSLTIATLSTALGSLASLGLAAGLARAFSGKGIVPDAVLDPTLLAAVALAAAATVLLATVLGLPVSTTHALVGGLAGAGFAAAGTGVDLYALASAFTLPLLLGPLASLLLVALVWRAARPLLERGPGGAGACVCVGEEWRDAAPAAGMGGVAALAAPAPAVAGGRRLALAVDQPQSCAERFPRGAAAVSVRSLVDGCHVLSAGLIGFARGLNDTPKVLGLLLGASVLAPETGVVAITAAMAAGGIVGGRRVTETLARRITEVAPAPGLAANLTTSVLVIGASQLGLPVSTTHVSTGAIVGVGHGAGRLDWGTIGGIAAAWLVTLPLGALLAVAALWVLA